MSPSVSLVGRIVCGQWLEGFKDKSQIYFRSAVRPRLADLPLWGTDRGMFPVWQWALGYQDYLKIVAKRG